jgi:hypothetical protein
MKKICWLIFAVILHAGCSKRPNQDPYTPGPSYNIPQEFKAWTVFNKGSWWVYKNESSNLLDTNICIHGPYVNHDPCGNCPVIEYNWFYLKGSVVVRYDVQGVINDNAILRIMTGDFADLFALTYKTIENGAQGDTSGYSYQYEFVEKLDSMNLNGHAFSNVYHTRITWKDTYYYDPPPYKGYDFYFARNIGLIMLKKDYYTQDTTWSLMNWHAIQ